jgi:NCAIR mutase (PurE)-related protein
MKALKNARHEKFCRFVADGKNALDACKELYPSSRDPQGFAEKLLGKTEVAERTAFLLKKQEEKEETKEEKAAAGKTLSKEEKREILAELVRNEENSVTNRIAAIKLDNSMTGDDKIEENNQAIINILNYHNREKASKAQ